MTLSSGLPLYSDGDRRREQKIGSARLPEENYRSEWRRDYARLIHSSGFRRLQGKTQLFPGIESDFFRNRLTHSLEVAQIAKSIAIRLNSTFFEKEGLESVDPVLTEFAAMAHDIGHPPFGHQGEEALDDCMLEFGGFEGNAQTLRLLSKLEKKETRRSIKVKGVEKVFSKTVEYGIDTRLGLNLTYRSLASILKYDNQIPANKTDRIADSEQTTGGSFKPIKGYYYHEADLVNRIKTNLIGEEKTVDFQTIECQIMDLADDIAYSTYDLEDALKAGFISIINILTPDPEIYEAIAGELNITVERVTDGLRDIFLPWINLDVKDPLERVTVMNFFSEEYSNNGYLRGELSSYLVGRFIRAVKLEYNSNLPVLSKLKLSSQKRFEIDLLKRFNYYSQIKSTKLKIVEYRGKEIVKTIFEILANKKMNGYEFMPQDFRRLYKEWDKREDMQHRVISDFIAGMTDKYASEFYGRLKYERPQTIFKPL